MVLPRMGTTLSTVTLPSLRDRVEAVAGPRVTAGDPPHGQQPTTPESVALEGFPGVVRTAREVAARRGPAGSKYLVETYSSRHEPDGGAGPGGVDGSTHRCRSPLAAVIAVATLVLRSS